MFKKFFRRKKENEITICVCKEHLNDMSCFLIDYMNDGTQTGCFSLSDDEYYYFISMVTKSNAVELSDSIKEKIDNVRYISVLNNHLVVHFK